MAMEPCWVPSGSRARRAQERGVLLEEAANIVFLLADPLE